MITPRPPHTKVAACTMAMPRRTSDAIEQREHDDEQLARAADAVAVAVDDDLHAGAGELDRVAACSGSRCRRRTRSASARACVLTVRSASPVSVHRNGSNMSRSRAEVGARFSTRMRGGAVDVECVPVAHAVGGSLGARFTARPPEAARYRSRRCACGRPTRPRRCPSRASSGCLVEVGLFRCVVLRRVHERRAQAGREGRRGHARRLLVDDAAAAARRRGEDHRDVAGWVRGGEAVGSRDRRSSRQDRSATRHRRRA